MTKINIAGRKIPVPGHRVVRMGLGGLLVAGGTVGFLPVLGFWMIPAGLALLAVDVPPIRRFQRRSTVKLGNWLHRRSPGWASKLGYGKPRKDRTL
ncbi:hypothetical protein [Aestuariivirga sp.]|uniref:hypothetical protein n=1 Tax=Aestuariivirga sp. TaxID=2650926 RepID=UPI003594145D